MAYVEGDADAGEVSHLFADKLVPYARPRNIKDAVKIPVTAAAKYERKEVDQYFN